MSVAKAMSVLGDINGLLRDTQLASKLGNLIKDNAGLGDKYGIVDKIGQLGYGKKRRHVKGKGKKRVTKKRHSVRGGRKMRGKSIFGDILGGIAGVPLMAIGGATAGLNQAFHGFGRKRQRGRSMIMGADRRTWGPQSAPYPKL